MKGEGPPVCLVTGLGGAMSWWKPQEAHFASRSKLILHDHRGTGLSSKNVMKYSVGLLADDLIALLDHLEIEAAHFVGHSTGAAMTQEIALRHPDRILSAVLSAGWPRADFLFQRSFEMRSAMLRDSGVEAYVKSTALFLFPPKWIADNAEPLQASEAAAIAAFPDPRIMQSRIEAICAHSPGEALRNMRCPTLVTCARDDILTPLYYSEEMARLIPNAAAYYFADGGHAMSMTRAEEYNRVVGSFVDAAIAGKPWSSPQAS